MPAITLPDPPISDGVVSLRTWRPDDVSWIVEACQDPEISRWTFVPSPYTEQDGRAFVAATAEELASGQTAKLAVVGARNGERLGSNGLVVIDWDRKVADVGYWVAAGARRRGIASRALVLVTRWAFDVLGLERLELRPRRLNVASRAVARRAGFTPDARRVISRPECDTLPDTLLYSLRREDGADLQGRAVLLEEDGTSSTPMSNLFASDGRRVLAALDRSASATATDLAGRVRSQRLPSEHCADVIKG